MNSEKTASRWAFAAWPGSGCSDGLTREGAWSGRSRERRYRSAERSSLDASLSRRSLAIVFLPRRFRSVRWHGSGKLASFSFVFLLDPADLKARSTIVGGRVSVFNPSRFILVDWLSLVSIASESPSPRERSVLNAARSVAEPTFEVGLRPNQG